jgi:hypothetical protein
VYKLFQANLEEERFFVVARQVIDNFEDDFPQSYDLDWEEKRVKYDDAFKIKVKGKTGFDLVEERRKYKWRYYLENPPNDRMRKLGATITDKDTFSDGIAYAYRLLSDKLHKGYHPVTIRDPRNLFLYQRVVDSLRIIFEEEGILNVYIEQLRITLPTSTPKTG